MEDSGRHAVHGVADPSRWRKNTFSLLRLISGYVAGSVIVSAVATAAISIVALRRILVPPTSREEDTTVVGVDHIAGTITFRRSADAVMDGLLSFWFDAARGHARVGKILANGSDTVTRQLLGVDFGDLDSAKKGRFNGWFYLYPSDLGVEYENVLIATELGPAPAWLIRPDFQGAAGGTASTLEHRWVIQVHGRAVMRAETIRAIPVFRDAGYTSLLISYRNDFEAPSSFDRRYSLGDTEWRDVEAAMEYALKNGASSIVLMGWSMGGAAVLQTTSRSRLAHLVTGVVLDSPVIDWVNALDFQGRSMGLIAPLRALVYAMIGSEWGRPFTGLQNPIDFRRLNFVARAGELAVPTLILHSDDDAYVPSAASRALARARPDIVTLESFDTARHTKLWNYDQKRWNHAISEWLSRLSS